MTEPRSEGSRGPLWLLVVVPIALLAFWLMSSLDEDPAAPATGEGDAAEATTVTADPEAVEPDAGPASTGWDAGVSPSGPVAPVRLSEPEIRRDPALVAGALAGTVRGWASGRPIAGAELVFGHDGATRSVRSDRRGEFELVPDEAGVYTLAMATADGFLPFAPEWGHSPIRFWARPGVRIEGVVVYLVDAVRYEVSVVDADGAPVPGAEIRVFGVDRGERALAPLRQTYTSDDEGQARVSAPDDSVIEASHDEAGRGRVRVDTSVQLSRRARIVLAPEPPASMAGDRTIAGRVVDPSGAPVEGALLVARFDGPRETHPERGAVSDADGAFSIDGLDEGAYELTATASGHARGSARAPAGATDVTIELGVEGRVRVRVVDGRGDPVPAATVVVERSVGRLEHETLGRTSGYDVEGEYMVDGLPAGPCRVVAVAPGYAASAPVSAVASEDPPVVEVTVSRGGTLVGRVVSARGDRPLESARVTFEGRLGTGSSAVPVAASALTDADGAFELSGAAPGLGSVVAWAADHHGRVRSGIAIVEGERVDLGTIDLSPVEPGEEPRIELAGIGAVLSADEDVLRIERVVEGGGAAEAGLASGDAVLEIENVPVGELGFGGSIERIRGPEGTSVRLRVQRTDAEESEIVAVVRRRIRA